MRFERAPMDRRDAWPGTRAGTRAIRAAHGRVIVPLLLVLSLLTACSGEAPSEVRTDGDCVPVSTTTPRVDAPPDTARIGPVLPRPVPPPCVIRRD